MMRSDEHVQCHRNVDKLRGDLGSMPFLVEIANGSMGLCHLFEAAFQFRLQRTAQADQLLAAAHFA